MGQKGDFFFTFIIKIRVRDFNFEIQSPGVPFWYRAAAQLAGSNQSSCNRCFVDNCHSFM